MLQASLNYYEVSSAYLWTWFPGVAVVVGCINYKGHLYYAGVEFYLYPTVGTVLIHSVKPELTE